MTARMTENERAAVIAHFSYELEPTTPLPSWDAVAMETVYLRNEVAALRAALDRAEADKAAAVEAERERCAVICQQQSAVFGSDEYALGQPLSSFKERFACGCCAAAIRNVGAA